MRKVIGMTYKNDLREKIENYTCYIRDVLDLSSPLNMLNVAQKLGISCNPIKNIDYDARLFEKGGRFHIDYDECQCFGRQQFSIAHELGHLFLHKLNRPEHPRTYYRKNGSSSQIEWEANEFAAALLMPRVEFIDFCLKNTDFNGRVNLEVVAKRFNVSKQSARVRGSVLGLWILQKVLNR